MKRELFALVLAIALFVVAVVGAALNLYGLMAAAIIMVFADIMVMYAICDDIEE